LLDIKNLSGRETKKEDRQRQLKEDRQRQLFDRLNKDSVMAGLLSPAKSKVGKITRVSFNQSTSEIFDSGFFENKDNDTIFKGVKNYLEAAEIVFKKSKSEKAKLTNSTFFRSLFSVFHDVVDKALKEYGDLKVDSFINVLEPISKLNYDSYTGTSNATLSKVVSDMKKELNEYERRYNDLNSQDLF
jgi:hypothetical protein